VIINFEHVVNFEKRNTTYMEYYIFFSSIQYADYQLKIECLFDKCLESLGVSKLEKCPFFQFMIVRCI